MKTNSSYFHNLINLTLLIFFFITSATSAQSTKEIQFVVISDSVPENSSVYITGNHPALGNWNPGEVKLEYQTGNEWSGIFYLPEGFNLEYKFTLGLWNEEALDEDGKIHSNSILDIVSDTTVTTIITAWGNRSNQVVEGQITGTVEYHYNLKGPGINDRDIIVWLPPRYYENKYERFPVLYVHDGQNMIDPVTSAFGVDWKIDEAADTLIKKGFIKPIIIVGIYNTQDRSDEYAPGKTGHDYMNFIVNNLKPFIDSTYRTLPDRENTATGGSSLGGLISFMMLWEYSKVFSVAACVSPAFKYSRID